MAYPCPKDPKGPYNLGELVARLKQNEDNFAKFFAETVKLALDNDENAINCVNSYFKPETQELLDLGIPESRVESLRRCTDSSLLVLVIANPNV